jgi:hypothetical protein
VGGNERCSSRVVPRSRARCDGTCSSLLAHTPRHDTLPPRHAASGACLQLKEGGRKASGLLSGPERLAHVLGV